VQRPKSKINVHFDVILPSPPWFSKCHVYKWATSPEFSWKPKYKMRNLTESRNSKGAAMVVIVPLAIATDLR
jgi:hypothetical protein